MTVLAFAPRPRFAPLSLMSLALAAVAVGAQGCVITNQPTGAGASGSTTSVGSASTGTSTAAGGSGEEKLDEDAPWATDGIHVATTGSDASGDGSAAAPYRTIQYALDNAASAGSTVLVHAGDYEGEVRIRHSNLLLQGVHGEKVSLHVPLSNDENAPLLTVQIDADTRGVRLRGLDVSGGFYAIYLESQWDYDDTKQDNLAASGVTVEDCVLHDTGRDVVKIPAGSDDVTIRRSEIFNSGMLYPPGAEDKNAEGIDAVNADDFRLADSYIHDTATTCVYVKGGSIGTVIERVRAERCGEMGIALGFETSPEWFDLQANPGYYESIGGVVRNSFVRDTNWAGIAIYASKDARVLHNTIVSSAKTLMSAIYFGAAVQDEDPNAGRPPNENPTIVGNVVDQSGVPDAQCVNIRYSPMDKVEALYGLTGPLTMQDNIYFAGGAGCLFVDNRPESLLEAGDLAAWQAHGNGFDVASRFSDPMLEADGRPASGSPAIDAVAATAGVTFDLEKKTRVAPFDLGAFER